MRTLRDTFEENYMAVDVPSNNRRGFKIRYEYVGLWYLWNEPESTVRTSKIMIGLCCAGSLLAYLCASLQYSPLNYSRFVMLPALLSVAAFLFEAIGVFQFCISKEKMTTLDFSGINTKLRLAPLIHAILLFATAAVCVGLMILEGSSVRSFEITALYLISGLFSGYIFYKYRQLTYRMEKNDRLKTTVK